MPRLLSLRERDLSLDLPLLPLPLDLGLDDDDEEELLPILHSHTTFFIPVTAIVYAA